MNFAAHFFNSVPLGMNYRNRLIRNLNSREALRMAKDKSGFKKILEENLIPVPKTHFLINDYLDLSQVSFFPDEFVVKPNRGSGGSGIIVLKKSGDFFVNPAGDKYEDKDIRKHIKKILGGEFSGYTGDTQAIIEERIYPSPKLMFRRSAGLPDIRVWCYMHKPVMAMMRFSTIGSKGRANLAKGAIGMGIDLDNGRITHIHMKGQRKLFRLEDFDIPRTFAIPKWKEIKELAVKASKLIDLKVAGADIVLDINDRVMMLEINGRPGLEIQNINEKSLLPYL